VVGVDCSSEYANTADISDFDQQNQFTSRSMWRLGGDDSPMDEDSPGDVTSSASLQSLLCAIIEERSREFSSYKFVSEDDGFLSLERNSFWTSLFAKHFLETSDDSLRDDLLFYVRKSMAKSKLKIPHTDVEVFRRSSPSQPSLDDNEIDWEETVYLNLILQHFEYYVTCAVCSRTGEKELQILKKFTQRVYASPSRRKMDNKGTEEEISYPNIYFTIDNFEEAFAEQIVRDSEMVCVELVAKDKHGKFQGVLFVGSIHYDALKRVYDARASLSHRVAQRMSLGWFRDHKRVEFVCMRGPQGKGRAEMAVSRVKGSGPETPCQTPSAEQFPVEDFEQNDYTHRRMSDPSSSWNYFLRGSMKRSGVRKSRSEVDNVDGVTESGCAEVEAGNIEDEFDESTDRYASFFGQSFSQAWHWFKETRRANCVALHSFLTYVMLPWHRIIADLLDVHQEPVLSFDVL
jgi:hypothetical protein